MRIKDIIDMDINDFNRLTKKELKDTINTMRSAIRKRIKRFEEAGFSVDDISVFDKTQKDPLSVKGKTFNQLRHEFMRGKAILDSPTGTLGQYREVRAESMTKLEKEGITVTPEQYDNFWKAYNRLRKTDQGSSAKANREFKYNLLREIHSYMENKNIDFEEVATKVYNQLAGVYEKTIQSRGNTNPIRGGLTF